MPATEKNIESKSDSLINLLTEQCADLENLLALAREENDAARQGNFGRIIDVYDKREEIGKRLETFQHQISELRDHLSERVPYEISNKIREVVNLTIAQDVQTNLLLTAARDEASGEIRRLGQSGRNAGVYLQERKKGLAFNEKA